MRSSNSNNNNTIIKNNQYRYAEPTIAIKFPFEKLSARRFTVRRRRSRIPKLPPLDFVRTTFAQAQERFGRGANCRTHSSAAKKRRAGCDDLGAREHSRRSKNLGIRLGRQYRIHYWSECKMTAYKTQTKKDEETGTVKLSKIIVELTLGRCEYHRPNDFAKGDVYVLSTDPGFFLSSPVAKNTRQGMDTYKNWTGVVASTWHAIR